MISENYQKEIDRKNIEKLNSILNGLPPYLKDFFSSRRINTSTRTRLAYAYDIRKFFSWLHESVPALKEKNTSDITIEEINNINTKDVEEFIESVMLSEENNNAEAAIARKIAALGAMFSYFLKHDMIDKNPCSNVDRPKLHSNEIVVLTPDEISRLLDTIQVGSPCFSEKQESYLSKTRSRDYTMVVLMLSTGVRVSEIVGLNIDDLYLEECRMIVKRKGGDRQSIYLSDEACDALKDYIQIRATNKKIIDGEKALFISLQGTRVCVQTVEDMVKKYAKATGIRKNITPHKFRKTYGTELYKETNDIYLVASALNHKDVSTTTKFYAVQSQDNLLEARNKIKLK